MRRTTKEINDMIDQCRDYYHDVWLPKHPPNETADAVYAGTMSALEWALGKKDRLPLLSKVFVDHMKEGVR